MQEILALFFAVKNQYENECCWVHIGSCLLSGLVQKRAWISFPKSKGGSSLGS